MSIEVKEKEKESPELTEKKFELEQKKFELEEQRFALEKQRFELEQQSKKTEFIRLELDQISKLLDVVKYLNGLQDGQSFEMNEGHQNTTFQSGHRHLNAHEEDVFNASLSKMKSLVGFK